MKNILGSPFYRKLLIFAVTGLLSVQLPFMESHAFIGPAGAGTASKAVITVSTVNELQDAVANLVSQTTILIEAGDYPLTQTLYITGNLDDVTIKSSNGNRDSVTIRGRGMSNSNYGNVPHGFLIGSVTNLTIADLTISDCYYHNIQIQGQEGPGNLTFSNLHLIDSGEQQIKGSTAGPPGPYADNGIVQGCLIEYTDRARSDYTNGVDILAGDNWTIRDNVFRRIRAPIGYMAGPTILMWRNCLNSLIERNLIIDCDVGIALGYGAPGPLSRDGETVYDHQFGVIRNNVIYRTSGSPTGDVGITVNYANLYEIYHNTVVLNDTFLWNIEYRWPASSGIIGNNLCDGPIFQRDSAQATLLSNLTTATESWFVNPTAEDLHLLGSATDAIDVTDLIFSVTDDIDGHPRPAGSACDFGADEYNSSLTPVPALQEFTAFLLVILFSIVLIMRRKTGNCPRIIQKEAV